MNFYKFLQILIALLFYIFIPFKTEAAILYLEPNEGQYRQGDISILEVKINTEKEYINVIEANLRFSQDVLEVKDFSKGNSILNLWAEEPNISNQNGVISFSGGVQGGYNGLNGFLGKIIFEAKKEGKGEIWFQEDSRVLLNDGFGTAADLKTQRAVFNISTKESGVSKNEWQKELEKDLTPPELFEIKISQDNSIFEGKYFIIFTATDKETGIDHYETKEGRGEWKIAQSPYLLENQDLTKEIKVKVVDKAGNYQIDEIKPITEITWKDVIILLLILSGIFIAWWLIKKSKII